MRKFILLLAGACCNWVVSAQSTTPRVLKPSDIYKVVGVGSPRMSPDGQWIAYTVSQVDSVADSRSSDIYMVSPASKEVVQLTFTKEGESAPEWSPDGKFLSFLAKRGTDATTQIYILNRKGGEAKALTKLKKGAIMDYAWSPDGSKIALAISQQVDTSKTKTPKPIVVNRFKFKQDGEGYISEKYTHLYLFDVATQKMDTLTSGKFSISSPAWSPDGKQIAYVSNKTEDRDKNDNTDIYVIEAQKGGETRQITTWTGSDENPVWSPDGRQIAYLRSTSSENYFMYDQSVLCVVPAQGGTPVVVTGKLDRPVSSPVWQADNQSIWFTVTDDRSRYIASAVVKTGKMTTVLNGERVFSSLEAASGNTGIVGLTSNPSKSSEIFSYMNGTLTILTTHQDAFFKDLTLAKVEGYTSVSKDGTKVSNILYRSPIVPEGQKAPTIFFIHGGPTAQDEYSFDMTRQQLAAHGFHVVAVNYRGSNGRGLAFNKAISADWGNLEVMDIHGAVDALVAKGVADSEKLGIGGWSYGGILTNYCIATDTRFKAGASGAGVAMISSMYGVDQYIQQYEYELGSPWKNFDKYVKLSYPFLKADRIKTPTQFMVGQEDSNVPAVGSEQMYQALKSLGIDTELIVYPEQFHGISKPSYQKDRIERYVAWFTKYLK
ncbi:MAG: alpha/beta fold hydrolase [Spirosomataceae bacterium]